MEDKANGMENKANKDRYFPFVDRKGELCFFKLTEEFGSEARLFKKKNGNFYVNMLYHTNPNYTFAISLIEDNTIHTIFRRTTVFDIDFFAEFISNTTKCIKSNESIIKKIPQPNKIRRNTF